MKKLLLLIIILCGAGYVYGQQDNTDTRPAPPKTLEERREMRQNRVIKEWNTEGKRKWMDRLTVWDSQGRKIEDIEYASYGQVTRIVSEYEGEDIKPVKEIVYNDKNKVFRIRKYDYNPDGTKKMQYNYLPNGKLYSTKIFEYSYK